MPKSSGMDSPADGFDDNAVRRELLRILDDAEKRLQLLMDQRVTEMRRQFESLNDASDEHFRTVLARLDAAKEKGRRRFNEMRAFVERQ